MAGNQIMPDPNRFHIDQATMLAGLNQVARIAGRMGYDREVAMNKLPYYVPIPLRFTKYGAPFRCKKCGAVGSPITRLQKTWVQEVRKCV